MKDAASTSVLLALVREERADLPLKRLFVVVLDASDSSLGGRGGNGRLKKPTKQKQHDVGQVPRCVSNSFTRTNVILERTLWGLLRLLLVLLSDQQVF